MYAIGRSAYLNVADDGRLERPLALTVFHNGEPPCIGRAERKVIFNFSTELMGPPDPDLEKGLVLEGCPPSSNTYAMFVMEGAHPQARLGEPAELDLASGGLPDWISARGTPIRTIYRFTRTDDIFVVVRGDLEDGDALDELQIGSGTRLIGTLEVSRNFDAPTLFDVDGRALVKLAGLVVWVAPERLLRIQEPGKQDR